MRTWSLWVVDEGGPSVLSKNAELFDGDWRATWWGRINKQIARSNARPRSQYVHADSIPCPADSSPRPDRVRFADTAWPKLQEPVRDANAAFFAAVAHTLGDPRQIGFQRAADRAARAAATAARTREQHQPPPQPHLPQQSDPKLCSKDGEETKNGCLTVPLRPRQPRPNSLSPTAAPTTHIPITA
eukprot:gene15429-biopygen8789